MLILEQKRLREESALDRRGRRLFEITSRRNRLVGQWAAGLIGLSQAEAESYRNAIVALGLERRGESAIVDRLIRDFADNDIDIGPERILDEMSASLIAAETSFYPPDGKPATARSRAA